MRREDIHQIPTQHLLILSQWSGGVTLRVGWIQANAVEHIADKMDWKSLIAILEFVEDTQEIPTINQEPQSVWNFKDQTQKYQTPVEKSPEMSDKV